MNKFVSSLLGAFVGTWIAFFLMGIFIFFVGIMIITSASLSSVSIEVKDNSILRIDLSGSITDKPYNKTLQDILEGSSDDGNSLHEILAAIDNASTDDRIKGIYLRCDAANTGMATASAIRKALSDFKKESGKWIYAYGHSYSQLDYYIASVADSPATLRGRTFCKKPVICRRMRGKKYSNAATLTCKCCRSWRKTC